MPLVHRIDTLLKSGTFPMEGGFLILFWMVNFLPYRRTNEADSTRGHLNHDTVDYIVQKLPRVVKDALHALVLAKLFTEPESISDMLRSSIQQVDDSLTSRVLSLLSENMNENARASADDIPSEFPDADMLLIAQSFGGATLVLSLTDLRGNLWIANLGALGDTWLKIPASYASHMYKNAKPPWISPTQFDDYALRILTPPYVSNISDVHYLTPQVPYFLLLGSDGLLSTERYNEMNATQVLEHWVSILGSAIDSKTETNVNAALRLLRDILGGDDVDMVSRNLTVEMDERWVDDITLLVQTVRIG
ncbi:hypothetical protein C0993_004423 [Termitomyces sp. T159_Od127]|nr:hypothetical protein C0993_004423 [Termitomyces sp. T159_Od127]